MTAFLQEVKHIASQVDNKQFAAMYESAVAQAVAGDMTLFNFMSRLERAPVGIEEFLDSTEFLGATDLVIWPEVRRAIIDINRNWWRGPEHAYREAILMGACVDAETEYLSPYGWKPISDYRHGDPVGQYHADGSVTFVTPQRYVKYRADHFLHFNPRGGVDMALTEGHRVIYRHHKTDELMEISAEDLAQKQRTLACGFKGKIVSTFTVADRPGIRLSDEEIRVMVMVHADGSFYEDTEWCNVIVKKARKVERATRLLEEAGIEYSRADRADGYTRLRFYAPERNKTYAGWMRCTTEQLRIVVDEVMHWDGSERHEQFYTAKKEEADFIQYAFLATGTRATMQWQNRGGKKATEYRVKACKKPTTSLAGAGDCVTEIPSQDGYCYCFTLDTGMWVARRNGSVFVTGNTGTGKSTIIIVSLLYHLYLLSCINKPQLLYGLSSATSIVFPIMGAKPNVVNKVIYAPMRKLLESMPYFQQHMMPNKLIDSEMYFEEKNVRVVKAGGDEDAILGEAVIGGCIDEINFMNVVLRSKKAEVTSGRAGLYDQAEQTHNRMVSRKKGRFTYPGPMIGIVFPSSSTRYRGDFTDKRKAFIEKEGITTTYIYNKRQYEVTPASRYSGETFRLLIGNDISHDTRVLRDDEEVVEGSWVEEVPIEYLEDFKNKPHEALRDVMGISHNAMSPFIKSRFKVFECVEFGKEKGIESFLVNDHVVLGVDGMPQVKLHHYCHNPSRPRYVHIDLSRNADRCGVAMLRFDGLVQVTRRDGADLLPSATVEMACTIEPDANNEIDIAEVRAFVRSLKTKYGYPIKAVTYDGFDSRESIQAWRKDGMPAKEVSVDKTSTPYKQFRDAMYDRRIALLDDPDLLSEIIELEYDENKDKVDHSVIGKKDLSDAVCAAYTSLCERRSTWHGTVDDVNDAMAGRADDTERSDGGRR